jgi:hypothetical protein
VKTPVIAVIEYNYERDGEIVVPAGTKAIGQLAQANQNGQVGLRFTALQMPDGGTENIEGSAVTLDYGPLRGTVNGQNRAKRALVRSLTGVGSMATYLVGGSGYGGLTGPVDQSILLRERIAEANPAIPSRQSRETASILRLRCMEVSSWAITAAYENHFIAASPGFAISTRHPNT